MINQTIFELGNHRFQPSGRKQVTPRVGVI